MRQGEEEGCEAGRRMSDKGYGCEERGSGRREGGVGRRGERGDEKRRKIEGIWGRCARRRGGWKWRSR